MKTPENKQKQSEKTQQCQCNPETERKAGHVVTQLTPDDLMTDGCLMNSSTGSDGEPTDQQLNQEVTAINPSVDSMVGRG